MVYVTVILILLTLGANWWGALILLILNAMLPDGVPVIDEVIQGLAVGFKLRKVRTVATVITWASRNRIKASVVAGVATWLFIWFVFFFDW